VSYRPPSHLITACLVCRNEADKIAPALESVQWVDEVIVLDLESSDGSAAVARSHGARVISRSAVPIVEIVRNEVADAALGDWILVLDPDERISPGLADRLNSLRDRAEIDAVIVPRMNVDLGYPPSSPIHRFEPQIRMYRRSRVRWPVFPNALPQVTSDRLYRVEPRDDLVLIHDRSRTVREVVDRVLRYAPAQGQAMADEGQMFTAAAMLAALGRKAHREFILAEPWRDGVPGLLRSGFLVAFHFYVWAAFWQASGARRTAADDRVSRRLGLLLRVAGLATRAAQVTYGAGRRLRRGRGAG
jgi:Glycosyl transferase family 2